MGKVKYLHGEYRLSAEELATILASLRYWQLRVQSGRVDGDARIIAAHEFGDIIGPKINPLDDHQIDELCEKLNFGGAV